MGHSSDVHKLILSDTGISLVPVESDSNSSQLRPAREAEREILPKRKSTMAGSVKRRAPTKAVAKKKAPSMKAAAKSKRYLLCLYITGSTPRSQQALSNIKRICDDHLRDAYELKVIDIYQSPQLAKDEQILATPTLIKKLPAPLRRLIGDFSNEERVLLGLDVKTKRS